MLKTPSARHDLRLRLRNARSIGPGKAAAEAREEAANAREHSRLTETVVDQGEETDLIMVETFDDDALAARFRMQKSTQFHLTAVDDGRLLLGQSSNAKGSVDVISRQTFRFPVGASARVHFSARPAGMEQVLRVTLLQLDNKPAHITLTRNPRGWVHQPHNMPLRVSKPGPDGPVTMIVHRARDDEFRFYRNEGDGPVLIGVGHEPLAAGREACELAVRSYSTGHAGEAYSFVDNMAVSRAEYAAQELQNAKHHPLAKAAGEREVAPHIVLPVR